MDPRPWWKKWVVHIAFSTALLGFGTAVVENSTKRIEHEKAVQMEKERDSEHNARLALEVERQFQQDAVRNFISSYKAHLERIDSMANNVINSRKNQAVEKIPEERIRKQEDSLRIEISALVTLVKDWRVIHSELAVILDGNINKLEAASNEQNFIAVRDLYPVIFKTLDDTGPVLEEGIRTMEKRAAASRPK